MVKERCCAKTAAQVVATSDTEAMGGSQLTTSEQVIAEEGPYEGWYFKVIAFLQQDFRAIHVVFPTEAGLYVMDCSSHFTEGTPMYAFGKKVTHNGVRGGDAMCNTSYTDILDGNGEHSSDADSGDSDDSRSTGVSHEDRDDGFPPPKVEDFGSDNIDNSGAVPVTTTHLEGVSKPYDCGNNLRPYFYDEELNLHLGVGISHNNK